MSEVIYSTNEAAGALPNGTLVAKTNSKPEDTHRDGARATVIGSIGPIYIGGQPLYGYWVRWESQVLPPVFIVGNRIKLP